MKKLVIAGGSGFLGDALVHYFGNKFFVDIKMPVYTAIEVFGR